MIRKEAAVIIGLGVILSLVMGLWGLQFLERAKIVRICSDFQVLESAVLALYVDTGSFPATETGAGYRSSKDGDADPAIDETDLMEPVLVAEESWNGPYLKRPPVPPFGGVYRYGNCATCLHEQSVRPGVNVNYSRKGTVVEQKEMKVLASTLDELIDKDPESASGKLKYTLNRIFYSIQGSSPQ